MGNGINLLNLRQCAEKSENDGEAGGWHLALEVYRRRKEEAWQIL